MQEQHGSMSRFRTLRETVHKHLAPGRESFASAIFGKLPIERNICPLSPTAINIISQLEGMIAVGSCVLGSGAGADGERRIGNFSCRTVLKPSFM